MKTILIACLAAAAQGYSSSNPDGAAWMPSASISGSDTLGRVIQEATLDFNPPYVDQDVTIRSRDAFGLGAVLLLPLGGFGSFRASYGSASSSTSNKYTFLGNYYGNENRSSNSGWGLGWTFYSQSLSATDAVAWGAESGPDGRFWFPALSLGFSRGDFDSVDELSYLNSDKIFRTFKVRGESDDATFSLGLPMPGNWKLFGGYGRQLQRSIVYPDIPSFSFSDGGNGSHWNYGAHKIFNMDGGDEKRGWNPDGKEGATRLGLFYYESWFGPRRTGHGYSGSFSYVFSSYATVAFDLDLGIAEGEPFTSGNTFTVTNRVTNRNSYTGTLALRFYIPGTLTRPWLPEAAPTEAPIPKENPKPAAAPKPEPAASSRLDDATSSFIKDEVERIRRSNLFH